MLFPQRRAPHLYEIGEFLVDVAHVDRWPLRGNVVSRKRRVALHRACHWRALAHTGQGGREFEDPHERLLSLLPGVEAVPFAESDQCCGFGGAFSINHGFTSAAIGLEKLRTIMEAGVEEIVSSDMGCLLHLDGLIRRHHLPLRTRHVMELMAEAIG